MRYPGSGESQQRQQQQEQSRMALTRQKSDISYDRERPFVAVKRAHEQLKTLTNGRQVSALNDLKIHNLIVNYTKNENIDARWLSLAFAVH